MNRNKFYLLIIIGLLLSNLLLTALFLFRPKREGFIDHNKPRNIVIGRLQFDEQQIRKYDELIGEHRVQIREKDRTMMQLKKSLFSLLSSPENVTSKADSLVRELGYTQQQIEKIHFDHFMDIKALCKPEQLLEYDKLAGEITEIFTLSQHHRLR